ncbi:hypothetical protein E0Z10_g1459 [Xylaria hypoxylon]|uniref:Uncharacterized protein n=1 Tax=Xylaria hypoxylon TaxID=37992 RepID=A0A4Z0YTA7_9PEZI|nr:hypothetical protein E0Z10_g1459 [Xylaria hypoxylon]
MTSQTNPASTAPSATGLQTEGVDSSLPQIPADATVTTGGLSEEGDITQQKDDAAVAPTTPGDGTEPVEGEGQKQQQQGGAGGKLRSVFSRSKKGSDEAEGQVKGEEGSATKH